MPSYQGGKVRLGKQIYNIINEISLKNGFDTNDYFEPFIGMAGVMIHFAKENKRNLYACDINKDLIYLWIAITRGWKPPTHCSEEQFIRLKNTKRHSALRGYVGIFASWNCIFFQGYRLNDTKDFLGEANRALEKYRPHMKNVNFFEPDSYDSFEPENMVIYCDPPYKGNSLGNKNNSFFQEFNHDEFWKIIEKWSEKNLVFVSESSCDNNNFREIWSAESIVKSNRKYKTKKYMDKLYIHKKWNF